MINIIFAETVIGEMRKPQWCVGNQDTYEGLVVSCTIDRFTSIQNLKGMLLCKGLNIDLFVCHVTGNNNYGP